MTDRPILFSAPMVRALLDGRKTQTRRVLTRHNATVLGHSWRGKSCPWEGLRFAEAVARTKSHMTGNPDPHLAVPFCHPADEPMSSEDCGVYSVRPVVEKGDRLWVKETWRTEARHDAVKPTELPREALISFDADYLQEPNDGCRGRTRVSIHMPRWASRLTLTVTEVRVQRLHDISREDAKAEGCPVDHLGNYYEPPPPEVDSWQGYAVASFALTWSELNGPESWYTNPWIVALTFTVEQRNIDQ